MFFTVRPHASRKRPGIAHRLGVRAMTEAIPAFPQIFDLEKDLSFPGYSTREPRHVI